MMALLVVLQLQISHQDDEFESLDEFKKVGWKTKRIFPFLNTVFLLPV